MSMLFDLSLTVYHQYYHFLYRNFTDNYALSGRVILTVQKTHLSGTGSNFVIQLYSAITEQWILFSFYRFPP